ncbi:helix-turn-helix domain-containing protein [Streptomyces sp. NPDC059398]|uniref:helix-turn-helix domain-containing protein n=1 Tax=Streptomyces sp. NPDC059398 TaxID=3346820 RepID=UPI00368FA9AE
MEQPLFGRRLRELRQARGLSQARLAGDEISTGYLSRLESGARQPTERVVSYLASQLGVEREAFTVSPGTSLAHALSLASSSEDGESMEPLVSALRGADSGDLLLRWQALWLLARGRRKLGDQAQELACLEELSEITDELGLPELQCRTWSSLARCLRATGQVRRAIEVARKAVEIAQRARLSVHDTGTALMALVSAEAEDGRLAEARTHSDELVSLVEGFKGTLRSEVLWSAATVLFRQGEQKRALRSMEEALEGLHSNTDLSLWVRLRLAAASLCLQSTPPLTGPATLRLCQAESALEFVRTPLMQQEFLTLKAHLAFEEGRYEEAHALLGELQGQEVLLTYRDRIRLGVLSSRLMILEGEARKGLAQLKQLGEEAHGAGNMGLAAEIWRTMAEILDATRTHDE